MNLDPGDLYTLTVTMTSQGSNPVIRTETILESTYPEKPTIVYPITPTEHSLHFGWTVSNFFTVKSLR